MHWTPFVCRLSSRSTQIPASFDALTTHECSDVGGAFLQGLALSGWSIGQNVRIDTRWVVLSGGR
jgi:hypothetical protein